MAKTGTQIQQELATLGAPAVALAARDKALYELAQKGETPSYVRSGWAKVWIAGRLRVDVMPNYYAWGTDSDPWQDTGSPFLVQRLADLHNAIMPSAKLLREIQKQSQRKWAYQDVKGKPYFQKDIEGEQARIDVNAMYKKLFADAGIAQGAELTIGYRKAVVCGPRLDGKKVAIAGGTWLGTGDDFVQSYSTIHDSTYLDCSHGIVLVSRRAQLDGVDVDLRDVYMGARDDQVALVSDQGRFGPYFPNLVTGGASSGLVESSYIPSVDGESSATMFDPMAYLDPAAYSAMLAGLGVEVPAGIVVPQPEPLPEDPWGDSTVRPHEFGGSGEDEWGPGLGTFALAAAAAVGIYFVARR